ncbi:hypothetical protein N9D04_00100 [bacterium]|nr:hypothetical protein [Candidatus Pelagibacter ubique]MDA9888990.1 hypothetical protein [bacterium]
MVKRNIPDWQISAFDKTDNSCVKTKPFNKRLKELEAAYAKGKQTTVKVEGIDVSILSLKEEPVKEEKDDKLDELKEYQKMRDRQRKEEQEKSKRDENKVVFTSAPRQDPNRGMRFVSCSEPINKGKLGSSKVFTKKKDKEYY